MGSQLIPGDHSICLLIAGSIEIVERIGHCKLQVRAFKRWVTATQDNFANYFCAYAQLYHQKQMLTDHNRMAAYHAAIVGNSDVFKDKVVMDVGTGSGILAGELI